MDSRPGQQNAELVALFKRAFDRIHISLVRQGFLLLLTLYDTVLQEPHDL